MISTFCDPFGSHWRLESLSEFIDFRAMIAKWLLEQHPFNAGRWQAMDVSQSPMHATHELLNVTIQAPIPHSVAHLQTLVQPDLPWAEDHFQERVGGKAINPGQAEAYWPYHGRSAELHKRDHLEKRYDHNYMERMWCTDLDFETLGWYTDMTIDFTGYRFNVGDLGSVVEQLKKDPGTRQAYLPIWFPEDTGATEGQRVPCSLGYHFLIRNNNLHVQYNLRSCEIYRHFTNDIYLAMRLGQWVADRVGVNVGALTMHMISFHGFVGDRHHIERLADQGGGRAAQ